MRNLLILGKNASFESVEYFVKRYQDILHFDQAKFDSLYDEFVAYQLLQDSDIPEKVIKGGHCCI